LQTNYPHNNVVYMHIFKWNVILSSNLLYLNFQWKLMTWTHQKEIIKYQREQINNWTTKTQDYKGLHGYIFLDFQLATFEFNSRSNTLQSYFIIYLVHENHNFDEKARIFLEFHILQDSIQMHEFLWLCLTQLFQKRLLAFGKKSFGHYLKLKNFNGKLEWNNRQMEAYFFNYVIF
jgi:hypothetical protein